MSLLLLFHGDAAAAPDLSVPFFVSEPETLTVLVSVTGGQSLSFGPDREDEGDIPLAVEWSTQNPGGFGDGAVTLSRPPWISAADAPLFAAFRVENQSGELRYQGRVKGTPQVDATTIRIEAEGLAAALDDNEFWRFLGAANDLSAWATPSLTRQADVTGAGVFPFTDGGTEPDPDGLPAVVTRMTLPFEDPSNAEMWFRADGIPIGAMAGTWTQRDFIDDTNADWSWEAALSASEAGAFDISSGDLRVASGPGTGTFLVAAADDSIRFAVVNLTYSGTVPASPFDGAPMPIAWVPTVFGRHQLDARELPDGRWGLLDADIVSYAVADGAPEIPLSPAFIDSGGFVVPHIVHTGTVRELIEQVSVYGGSGGRLNDWGVYESFFWRAPGWGETWRVRRDEVEFSEGGPTTENRCSGMVVAYADGAGQSFSVGPPASGADFETSDLEDSNPLNPIRKTRVRDGGITNQQGAINIGITALREANAINRRGQVTVTDTVRDSSGNQRPVASMRACDSVVIEDEAGGLPPETQPIVGTSYSDDAVSCELGLPAPSVEALLARLAAFTG